MAFDCSLSVLWVDSTIFKNRELSWMESDDMEESLDERF